MILPSKNPTHNRRVTNTRLRPCVTTTSFIIKVQYSNSKTSKAIKQSCFNTSKSIAAWPTCIHINILFYPYGRHGPPSWIPPPPTQSYPNHPILGAFQRPKPTNTNVLLVCVCVCSQPVLAQFDLGFEFSKAFS